MKKLLVALLVVFCGLPCLAQTREPVYVDGVNVYSKPKIYANSFDGFLNMRSAPSTSGNIVGVFRNGEVPGYVIKQEGNWAKIYYQGVTGYVYKKNTSSSPTVAVTVDVDAEWLQGIWVCEEEDWEAFLLFDNGTYEYRTQHDYFEYGTYRLGGNSIILTPSMNMQLVRIPIPGGGFTEDREYIEDPESLSFVIDTNSGKIGEMKRKEFVGPEDAYGHCNLTREQFFKAKESVKVLLKK